MKWISRREALACSALALSGCGAQVQTGDPSSSGDPASGTDLAAAAAAKGVDPKIDPAAVKAAVQAALKFWEVPGAAVGIVHRGQVVYLEGHGLKELGQNEKMTPNTLFAIASCTKAFTTTAMAMLVDERKLHWDLPVRDVLDYFRLADPSADRLVTLRDLVCHRTGLGSYDLLWYRAPWDQREAIRRIARLAPDLQFRSSFQYQSTMVAAAGYAVAVAAGKPWTWQEFVQKRILEPLDMRQTYLTTAQAMKQKDVATPHRRDRNDNIKIVDWYEMKEPDPAGSIASCAADLCKWTIFHLNGGTVERDGAQVRLVSREAMEETHAPQNHIPLKGTDGEMHPDTYFMSYCMGWVRQDYHGRLVISHAGTIDGFRTHITFLPKEQLGIVLLNNLHGSDMNLALRNTLIDQALDLPRRDWNAYLGEVVKRRDQPAKERDKERKKHRIKDKPPTHDLAAYQGEYVDPVFGTARVTLKDGKLIWEWSTFRCPLEHYHFDTFIGRDEILHDPVVAFALGLNGQVVTMNALDRYFIRVK
jgi:CubicO group peptidase (beta-lactamase class C family)